MAFKWFAKKKEVNEISEEKKDEIELSDLLSQTSGGSGSVPVVSGSDVSLSRSSPSKGPVWPVIGQNSGNSGRDSGSDSAVDAENPIGAESSVVLSESPEEVSLSSSPESVSESVDAVSDVPVAEPRPASPSESSEEVSLSSSPESVSESVDAVSDVPVAEPQPASPPVSSEEVSVSSSPKPAAESSSVIPPERTTDSETAHQTPANPPSELNTAINPEEIIPVIREESPAEAGAFVPGGVKVVEVTEEESEDSVKRKKKAFGGLFGGKKETDAEVLSVNPPAGSKPGKKGFGSLFGISKREEIRIYNPQTDEPLLDAEIPEGYEEVESYWIQEGMSRVIIAKNLVSGLNEYLLFEPPLTEFERELAERLYEDMRDVLILTDDDLIKDRGEVLMEKMAVLLKEYRVTLEDDALFKLQYYLIRNFLGWSKLEPLIKDPNIEDISCDGADIPVFLYHRKYHNIKTNLRFEEEMLYSLAITLAQRSGKHISVSQPMLDATMPDGSRLQLTLGREVTSRGTSFTIRKFREEPFTPVELIELNTFSIDELVYFWLGIENNKSLLFVGGTASGKTTSLNAVSLFIPPIAKVVSIEDTREITLFHDNWIASVTRESVSESGASKIDMFDLLKAAMRQRPEYILVGEVRGMEAQTLFQAMNTGHTTFSTLHANNVDAAIHRLENAPLNVPRNMVQALDIVSIQSLIYRGQDRVRRSMEIVEIIGIDPSTGSMRVNTVFEYDPITDRHTYKGRSQVYSAIMEVRGWSNQEMSEEVEKRIKILDAMHDQGMRDYISFTRVVQSYAINPEKVLENLDDLKKALI